MTSKFIRRTIRNIAVPRHPYFAHLAITHRCNLRCRFCHVTETQFSELDTESMKRVIDTLDRIGVAVVSISGGGEPLLREDFDEIINYAGSKGLYVKITSNGTMPRAKYERLLRSRINEISISLDGVSGWDLPFSHVGTPILSTIEYLDRNLPAGKKLTINVTVSASNRGQVQEILDYCAKRYPRARVWLNPVVVGEGALRTLTTVRTEPDYLRQCRGDTLLSARFYADGADRQYREERFDWGCLAGDQFFDVKPDGTFWLCQDQPSTTPLNVLDPDFEKRRKQLHKGSRRNCSGCIYSCYYLVQNSFLPSNWPDVALLWWLTVTAPGSIQRVAAERFGWVAGLASYVFPQLSLRFAARLLYTAVLVLLLAAASLAFSAQSEPSPQQLVSRMEEAGRLQRQALEGWTSTREYQAENRLFSQRAKVRVEVEYTAPDRKSYRILEQTGSGFVIGRVIRPILETECETARNSALTHIDQKNYDFHYLEFDTAQNAYVFEAWPRTPHKYLFHGKVWVDAQTFGIRRIRGSPARSPSFWVKRTEFAHEYVLVDGFWLPASHRSQAELRLFGTSTLTIEYLDHRIADEAVSTRRRSGRLHPPNESQTPQRASLVHAQ